MKWLDKLLGKDKLSSLSIIVEALEPKKYYKVIAPRYFGLCGNGIYYAKYEVFNYPYEKAIEAYSSMGKIDVFDYLHAINLNSRHIQITESEYLKLTDQT